MLVLFLTAFALGLVFNAAPGAVFAETVRQGVHGGYRAALGVQLGSLVGDAAWALLGLAGIGLALQFDILRWPVGISGTAYLLWLSWDSWREARVEHVIHARPVASDRRAVHRGITLSLTNPQNIAYWAAMGGALGAVGLVQPGASDYTVFFIGFMASSLVWAFFFAALVNRLFRGVDGRWTRFTYRFCAMVLLALALGTLRELLQPAQPTQPAPLMPLSSRL